MAFTLARPRLLPLTSAAMAGLLLVKSAGLVQAAVAGTGAPSPSAPPQATPVAAAPLPAPHGQPQPAADVSEEERALLLDLRHRREALDARARLLDQRAAELSAADHKLDARVQQLTSLQSRLEGLEAQRQERQAANWTGLVKTYEAMKPRDAAAIFDALDMQVLLPVLDRMQERRAAAVLAAMQPDRARLATQLLSEMRTRSVTMGNAAPGDSPPHASAAGPPAAQPAVPKT